MAAKNVLISIKFDMVYHMQKLQTTHSSIDKNDVRQEIIAGSGKIFVINVL